MRIKTILLLLLSITILYANYAFAASKPYIALMYLEPLDIKRTDATIITNRLRNELLKTDQFNLLERNKMYEILREQGFQSSGYCADESCAIKIGKLVGLEQIIFGSVGKIGSSYNISARIVDVQSGKIIKAADEVCKCDEKELIERRLKVLAYKLAGLKSDYGTDTDLTDTDLEAKYLRANEYLMKKKFREAEKLYKEIIEEGKDTIWEKRAHNGLLTINNALSALDIANMNVIKGTLWRLNKCIGLYFAQNEHLPEINNLAEGKDFFEKYCQYENEKFWSQNIENIYLKKDSQKYFEYKIYFDLKSGTTMEVSNNGIKEAEQ